MLMPFAIETWRDLKLRRFLLYDEAYVAIGYDDSWSGAIRLVLLLAAMLLAVAFLVLMPRGTTLVHAPSARPRCTSTCCTRSCSSRSGRRRSCTARQPCWVLPAMILFCIGISVVLSLKPVRRVFRPLVEPRARWLFRAEPATATGTLVLPPGAMPPPPAVSGEPPSGEPASGEPAPEDPPATGPTPPR